MMLNEYKAFFSEEKLRQEQLMSMIKENGKLIQELVMVTQSNSQPRFTLIKGGRYNELYGKGGRDE